MQMDMEHSLFDDSRSTSNYNMMERELSLLYMSVRDFEREEKENKEVNIVMTMKLKFYQQKLELAERRVVELEKQNKKIRKQLRPSFFSRMLNKFRGYKRF